MPLNLALCCARGRGAYCCPPPGDHAAPPLRADAAAANDDGGGDWCCYEQLPVSTPPHVPRGLARGGEDEDEDDDDGLELTMTRGAPGVRDDADDQQLVSPAAAAGGVGFAKSWIASVYERLSRTFSVLP